MAGTRRNKENLRTIVRATDKSPSPIDEALAAILKPIVREAVREAMDQNGHGVEKPTEIPKCYFTIKEAATFSLLGPSTIRLYIRKRELKAHQVGRRVIIKRTDLEGFLESHPIEILSD